jgi:hypothetical protein
MAAGRPHTGHEFCWRCTADYELILRHGNHHHRPTCTYYAAWAGDSSQFLMRANLCDSCQSTAWVNSGLHAYSVGLPGVAREQRGFPRGCTRGRPFPPRCGWLAPTNMLTVACGFAHLATCSVWLPRATWSLSNHARNGSKNTSKPFFACAPAQLCASRNAINTTRPVTTTSEPYVAKVLHVSTPQQQHQ